MTETKQRKIKIGEVFYICYCPYESHESINSASTAPLNSFLRNWMKESDHLMHQPLYFSDSLNRRLGGCQTQSEGFGEDKPLSCARNQTACRLVTVPTELWLDKI
jgi:hypothetical protein